MTKTTPKLIGRLDNYIKDDDFDRWVCRDALKRLWGEFGGVDGNPIWLEFSTKYTRKTEQVAVWFKVQWGMIAWGIKKCDINEALHYSLAVWLRDNFPQIHPTQPPQGLYVRVLYEEEVS